MLQKWKFKVFQWSRLCLKNGERQGFADFRDSWFRSVDQLMSELLSVSTDLWLRLYKSLVIESSSRVPNQTCWKNSKARRFQKEKWRTQNLVEFDRSWTRWGHQTEVLLQFYSRNLRAFRGNCRSSLQFLCHINYVTYPELLISGRM